MATALLTSPLDVLKTRLQSDFYRRQPKPASTNHRSSISHFRETIHTLLSIYRFEGRRSLFKGLGPSLTGIMPATAIKFYTYGNSKRIFPDLLGCDGDATPVHILSAATAGLVTGTVTNPIWVIKTRLQLDRSRTHTNNNSSPSTTRYRNSLDCFRQVLYQEGVRGLYRGLGASYLGVIETTLHLAVYERLKRRIAQIDTRDLSGWSCWTQALQVIGVSAASGLSKLMAVLIAYPHEVGNVWFCPLRVTEMDR